jgi:hypothetical protein
VAGDHRWARLEHLDVSMLGEQPTLSVVVEVPATRRLR